MKKIAVMVNKGFEMEAVAGALVNSGLRAKELPFPTEYYIPKYNERTVKPRLVFEFADGGAVDTEVKVWCIQDIMFWDLPYEPAKQSGSSSEEKYRVLPQILKDYNPDLVISVSTAGYPADCNYNGSVVLGGNFFIYDGHPGNPLSDLKHKDFMKLLENNANEKLFSLINHDFRNKVEPKFLKTPRTPCEQPCCFASKVFTALSSVNVTDYVEYNWVDHNAVAAIHGATHYPCTSSETTHGVVKLVTDKPIIFLSPITDRFGHFDFDVTPTQNFAASFNGGIVLGELLCELNRFSKAGNRFAL